MNTTPTSQTAPAGYREDPKGNLVAERNIHPRDLLADQLVRDLIGRDYLRAVRLARGTSYREVRRATTENPLAAAMNDW